ncbi:MAG TPA: hypothetical protein HPP51_04035 [Planctomycetes bacterium]|nr:hypothetical protein [Planctomycetota bacterium]
MPKIDVIAEIAAIETETTVETLARKSVKKGYSLSKSETVEFLQLLERVNPEKKEHLKKITRNKLSGAAKRPPQQMDLYKQLGF